MLHSFQTSVAGIPLPERFTYPFSYTPHPLCVRAAGEVQRYLQQQTAWQEELAQGKMFGVLVVQTADGSIGYLAAFSGILAGSNRHPYFVPPVYDLLQPDGFFKAEEAQISAINARISSLEEDEAYTALAARLTSAKAEAEAALAALKQQMKSDKARRDERRRQPSLSAAEAADLIRESQFQKAEYKRAERRWQQQIAALQALKDEKDTYIGQLKHERKMRSAALQQKLFGQFRLLNYRGEVRDLCDLFGTTAGHTPPAGAGECAAPKLLQQAYLHRWKPLAMAEFWWGASPKAEIRRHGHYYPACKGKCEPILRHMLQGLNVDPDPLQALQLKAAGSELSIVYEDPSIAIVNKPAGMLSVPGNTGAPSVARLMRQRYPDADSPLMVHRLDMATSGLLLIAKTKAAHQNLQEQFRKRTIKKRYIALLDGIVAADSGTISLPLAPDALDRPRQLVSPERGKAAVTRYEVLQRTAGHTRIAFEPLTGRTHQLRVHAAHPDGLHCPIKGDELYGRPADRLYLHAETLEFTHPVSGRRMKFTEAAPF